MEMNIQEIGFEDLEIWENSPRLPEYLRGKSEGLSAEEKRGYLTPFYTMSGIVPLAGSLSVNGWSPIEHIWTIRRNGKFVAFDGNRRIMACYLLLNPEHPLCPHEIKMFAEEMSDEVRESLQTLTVMEWNSSMYTLDSAYERTVPFNKGLRGES